MAELILALDLPSKEQALDMAQELKETITWCKVGLELFTRFGSEIIEELKALKYHIFLDLKFYDIPNTVAKAVTSACELGVELLTLHCQGGLKMLTAASDSVAKYKATHGSAPKLFGVTVLTSFSAGEMPCITLSPLEVTAKLAHLASLAKLDGLVLSAKEVASIKQQYPTLQFLCPGIRPDQSSCQDQARVSTPFDAVLAGANFLVVGRPILQAKAPKDCAEKILAEMQAAESKISQSHKK